LLSIQYKALWQEFSSSAELTKKRFGNVSSFSVRPPHKSTKANDFSAFPITNMQSAIFHYSPL